MIAALFALAATMIVAGAVAVLEGFPYVRLESGMAMVYTGSVVGSAGVVLLGLAVVAQGLRRIEGVLTDGRPAEAPAPEAETALKNDDILTGLAGPAEQAAAFPAPPVAPKERTRIEPALLLSPAPEESRDPREPELPLPGLTPSSHEAKPKDGVAETAKRPLFAPLPPQAPEPEAPALRPSLDIVPDPAPKPVAEPASAFERTVVGRYSSGGNTYVMFDDGSIEADTPNGRFTFASLDELKAFVDSGGEAGTRGAA